MSQTKEKIKGSYIIHNVERLWRYINFIDLFLESICSW